MSVQHLIGGRPPFKPSVFAQVILAHGNSLVAGTGVSGAAKTWPAVLATLSTLAGSGLGVQNSGIGGQTILVTNSVDSSRPKMINTGPTAIDVNFQAGKLNILLAMEFTNELQSNGADVAAAHANWITYCAARRAAAAAKGAKLRIMTISPPPGAYQPPGQSAINQQVAAQYAATQYMRTHWREHSDAYCDLSVLVPAFGALFANGDWSAAAFAATGLFTRTGGQGDGQAIDYVHGNDVFYALIAQAANVTLRRMPG